MKKLFVLIICCILPVFCGCAGKASAGFTERDLVLSVSGTEFHTRDDIKTVIAALGDGYEYAEGKSCDYDGLDKTYIYTAATFYTNPLADGDLLAEIYSESPETVTSKGISPGASKADVLAAYGDPAEQDDYLLIYRASEGTGAPALCFELEGDTVAAVFLTVDPV